MKALFIDQVYLDITIITDQLRRQAHRAHCPPASGHRGPLEARGDITRPSGVVRIARSECAGDPIRRFEEVAQQLG
ncbi:hypothetical protein [Acuticoccus sp. I52.16.1]|uniref:hypothetical protein n=1 Tax=Acuticoccus sp. I52.16.1 TaxID=2928472 RepID=UPI001FD4B2A5|nr:hypothetical protein [Acuticoccus sp. I52.16.1]UOM36736.1 hypothetical protein MRB58_11320 [Acuticoccus sp. I52.16.1]